MLGRGGLRKLLKSGLRLAEATPGHGDGSGCRVGRVAVACRCKGCVQRCFGGCVGGHATEGERKPSRAEAVAPASACGDQGTVR